MPDLSRLFVDTAYVQGLYNSGDESHDICNQAVPFAQKAMQLFTTDAILMEIGNAFSTIQRRAQGSKIIRDFLKSRHIIVINLSPEYFQKAVQFYEERNDKEWGLTDCFSFIVMNEYHLEASLTVDHHFSQAGFKILPF